MNSRTRVTLALDHTEPDRVPRDSWLTPGILELFHRKTGRPGTEEDFAQYFRFDTRLVGFTPSKQVFDWRRFYREYYGELPDDTYFSSAGMACIPGNFHHYIRGISPLARCKTLKEIEAVPDSDYRSEYRYADLESRVAKLHQRGYYVVGTLGHGGFEGANNLRGILELLEDLVSRPIIAETVIQRVVERQIFMAKRFAQAGVDALETGNDFAMETRLFMSPQVWRQWFKPRLLEVAQAVKRIDERLRFIYHCCGFVEPLVPDLIECGVDVLHSVQPESVDPASLKKEYGKHLSFWGTVGTQTTMPFGSPEHVRREVRSRMQTVGIGGGLVLGPCQALQPDVSWDNIVACFEAIDEYGSYG